MFHHGLVVEWLECWCWFWAFFLMGWSVIFENITPYFSFILNTLAWLEVHLKFATVAGKKVWFGVVFLKNCWAYATHRSIPGTNPVRLGLAHNWWTQQRRLSDHSTCWFSNFANKTTFACIFFQRSLVMTIPINSIQVFFLRVDRWGNSDLSSYFLNILCLKTSDNVRLLSVLSAIQRPGCVASQTDASQHQSCRKSSFHYGLRLFLGLSFMSWLGQM